MVDLHADDSRISEDEAERHLEEPAHEKALKICRTVTQVGAWVGVNNGSRSVPRAEAALGRETWQATKLHACQATDLFNSVVFTALSSPIDFRVVDGQSPMNEIIKRKAFFPFFKKAVTNCRAKAVLGFRRQEKRKNILKPEPRT